jgi:preprotein translocase subunit SecD
MPLGANTAAGEVGGAMTATVIEGTQLKSASYGIPQNSTSYAVNLAFKSDARKTFADTSTALNQNVSLKVYANAPMAPDPRIPHTAAPVGS